MFTINNKPKLLYRLYNINKPNYNPISILNDIKFQYSKLFSEINCKYIYYSDNLYCDFINDEFYKILNKVFPHPEMGFYSNLLDKGK
jgi:hypothetical protein